MEHQKPGTKLPKMMTNKYWKYFAFHLGIMFRLDSSGLTGTEQHPTVHLGPAVCPWSDTLLHCKNVSPSNIRGQILAFPSM